MSLAILVTAAPGHVPQPLIDQLAVGGRLVIPVGSTLQYIEVLTRTEEGIEHGMLDYPGVANLAAQKHYVALYVAPTVLAQHREAFAGIDAGKSCLRFKRSEQLDSAALRKLLDAVVAFRRSQPGDDTVHQRLSR